MLALLALMAEQCRVIDMAHESTKFMPYNADAFEVKVVGRNVETIARVLPNMLDTVIVTRYVDPAGVQRTFLHPTPKSKAR